MPNDEPDNEIRNMMNGDHLGAQPLINAQYDTESKILADARISSQF
jgi:hypothetical protein